MKLSLKFFYFHVWLFTGNKLNLLYFLNFTHEVFSVLDITIRKWLLRNIQTGGMFWSLKTRPIAGGWELTGSHCQVQFQRQERHVHEGLLLPLTSQILSPQCQGKIFWFICPLKTIMNELLFKFILFLVYTVVIQDSYRKHSSKK